MKVKRTYTTLHVCMCILPGLLSFTSGSIPRCDQVQWNKRMFCTTDGQTDFPHLPLFLSLISPLFSISILSCSADGIAVSESHSHKRVLRIERATGHESPSRLRPSDGFDLKSIHSYHVRLKCGKDSIQYA